jgi:uncharacterized protein
MPLVKPKEKEKREDFIERCMGDKTSAEDYPSRNQRFAVCNSLYNERNKKEKITMENYLRGYHDTDKDKMGMDEEKPKSEHTDMFNSEDEARERAKEIGCVGIHTVMDNGKQVYMPCGTHDSYMEAIAKMAHDETEEAGGHKPEEEMGAHEDEEDKFKKPNKKEICVCHDDGKCQCDTEIKKVVFESEVKAGEQGIFSGYGSIFGNEDQGNDIVQKGAFTKSLKQRPANKVKMLFQHKTDEPIGVFDEIYEDQKGLFVKGRLALGTQKGREAYELLKMGALDGMSIGFRADPQKQAYNENKRGVRTLKEVDLMEISLVTFPMNENALITSVKGNSKSIREWEEILREVGGLSRTESKVGAKAIYKSLNSNQRDADQQQELVSLITKVANIIKQK